MKEKTERKTINFFLLNHKSNPNTYLGATPLPIRWPRVAESLPPGSPAESECPIVPLRSKQFESSTFFNEKKNEN